MYLDGRTPVVGRKRERLAERRKAMGLSQERLAEAVGVDASTVARWERGETEPLAVYRPRLAEALNVSLEELGRLLTGHGSGRAAPAYVAPYGPVELLSEAGAAAEDYAEPPYAWGALRTLEDLAVFLRSDMLTRRDILAASITMAAGKALTEPVARWLSTVPGGLPAAEGRGLGKIGMSAVEGIEQTVRYFVTSDASAGGGLAREAAVGQLKYAVDLAQYSNYSEAVGTRLLTVIANLASRVGWMSHDAGMAGPAQRYAWYGLRAAHEAGTEQAQLLAVRTLDHLAEYAREAGHLDTARRLNGLALDRIPDDPRRFNAIRAIIRSRLAIVLGRMGTAHAAGVDRHIDTSFDLHHQAQDDEPSPWLADCFTISCAPGADAELASEAAASYLALAREDVRLATRAQRYARQARDRRRKGFTRSRVFDQVMLARTNLRAGELDQACRDGQEAIRMAATVNDSQRVRTRLRQLMDDTAEHQREPTVRELREELRVVVAGTA
jgi:transcriptional regulator with XRE-family HTH domain